MQSFEKSRNAIKQFVEEELRNFRENLEDALDDDLDYIANCRVAEIIKNQQIIYNYEWLKPEIYEREEFKHFNREELPKIIHVAEINIFKCSENILNLIVKKYNELFPGSKCNECFGKLTKIGHILFACGKLSEEENIYCQKTMVYITLEGNYFFKEDIETVGMSRICDTFKNDTLPLPKQIYEKIIYSDTKYFEQIFQYEGDIENQIKINWLLNPININLQSFE